jgi:hypothetical protein
MSDCTRLSFEPSITTARSFHRVDRLLLQRESADNNLQSLNLLMPSAVVATCAMSCGSDLRHALWLRSAVHDLYHDHQAFPSMCDRTRLFHP